MFRDHLSATAAALGGELERARMLRRLTQRKLAAIAGVGRVTLANLERSQGSVAALVTVLAVLSHRFRDQPPGTELGPWLAQRRKQLGLSQDRLRVLAKVSGPALVKVEHGRGHVSTLLAVMAALGIEQALSPYEVRQSVENPLRADFLLGDCVETMRTLAGGSVELVITSPPYRAGKEYEESQSVTQYARFAQAWCAEIPRVLSEQGTLWLNLGYTKTSATTTMPLTYLYFPLFHELGLHLVQELVWHYEGGMTYKRRFAHRTERWLWFVKNPKRYTFELDAVRDRSLNRTDDDRNHPLGKNPTDYWSFNRVVGGRGASAEKTEHPCQFPLEMIERIVRACSRPGDTILDCFGGSGTTALAASRNGRGFISIERDATYDEIARQRHAKELRAAAA